jgi:hypothetical protein
MLRDGLWSDTGTVAGLALIFFTALFFSDHLDFPSSNATGELYIAPRTSSLRKPHFSLNPRQSPSLPVFTTFGLGMKINRPNCLKGVNLNQRMCAQNHLSLLTNSTRSRFYVFKSAIGRELGTPSPFIRLVSV